MGQLKVAVIGCGSWVSGCETSSKTRARSSFIVQLINAGELWRGYIIGLLGGKEVEEEAPALSDPTHPPSRQQQRRPTSRVPGQPSVGEGT
jgi:hypothetical protein